MNGKIAAFLMKRRDVCGSEHAGTRPVVPPESGNCHITYYYHLDRPFPQTATAKVLCTVNILS